MNRNPRDRVPALVDGGRLLDLGDRRIVALDARYAHPTKQFVPVDEATYAEDRDQRASGPARVPRSMEEQSCGKKTERRNEDHGARPGEGAQQRDHHKTAQAAAEEIGKVDAVHLPGKVAEGQRDHQPHTQKRQREHQELGKKQPVRQEVETVTLPWHIERHEGDRQIG